MSRQQRRRDSLDDSDTSSFDSNEQLSDLEDAEFPERSTDRVQKKRVWVMRSGPSRTKSDTQQAYAPVAGDDQFDATKPSTPEDAGDEAFPEDGYSAAEKGRQKSASSGSANQAQEDYPDADAESEEYARDSGDKESRDPEAGKKSSKKIWVYVGIAAIVLLLILLGAYFLWLRSKSDDSGKNSSSPSSSSAQSAPVSPISSASLSSSVAPVTTLPVLNATLPVSNATLPTSIDLTSVSSAGPKPIPASSVRQTPTPTSTAQDSTSTFFAQITWFNDEGVTTACGSHPNDGDYVVRISEELYGDLESVSPLCGKWISLYQLETDSYTKASIEGICTSCTGNNIDLSRATFWALTQNMKLGTTLAQWWWTAKGDSPLNTLEREAPVAHATSNARPHAGAKANSTNTTPISSDGFEPDDTVKSGTDAGMGGARANEFEELSDVDA